jgi:hypothetical protein
MSISFFDTFNPFYDQYSINHLDFTIPDEWDLFLPDNTVDFQCLSVIAPNPTAGATIWTQYGRWITLGIYRDEGRDPEQRPPVAGLSWTRVGRVLTITDPAGHRLRQDDVVNVTNVNVPLTNVSVTVVDSVTFQVPTLLYGDNSGSSATYQPTAIYNFYEQNYVFRLLPSFQLVPYSVVQQIFAATAPTVSLDRQKMLNVTSNTTVSLPTVKNVNVNYDLPIHGTPIYARLPLGIRFGQVYDDQGDPLALSYLDSGQPKPTNEVDSVYKNDPVHLDPDSPDRVYVYDFYGLDVNDPTRSPYFSSSIITRDPTISGNVNNILRRSQNGTTFYKKNLYDLFGNRVIGIQATNALTIRQNVLPLTLDNFNRPTKRPAARN